MKEYSQNPRIAKTILLLTTLLLLTRPSTAASCTRERCCALTTCTSLYCQQQSSQTWISSENYDKYQFTKLVMANNQCKPCSYNCKKCTSELASACTDCYDGYYLDAVANLCMPCDYKCLKCQVINGLSKCSLCDDGAYLDTTTLACKLCPMGAKSCVDPTNIVDCNAGYLKSSNSLFCTPCVANCVSCPSSTSVCSVCTTGYFVSAGTCRLCTIANCANCLAVGASTFCSACNEGYFRASSTLCSSCPLNCKICSSATVCTTCKTGYFTQAGGCSVVATPISNCSIYSNSTVNGINKCSTCISGYYLSTTGLQCIPCSITCSSCYGDHFGKCTACVTGTKLYNQMCVPVNYVDAKKLQLYYTAVANVGDFVGGGLVCSGLLYSGVTVTLRLDNLAAYKVVVSYRIFTDLPTQQYTISINSTSNSTSLSSSNTSNSSFTYSSSSLSYQLCQPSTTPYYSHISTTTLPSLRLQNTLTFSSSSSSNLYISQLLVTAFKCAPLCLECSQNQCYTCLTGNLYKQDAYCVYICGNGYYTYEERKECVRECPLGTYGLLTNISCMACVAPCVTCLNDKFCLSCETGYFLSPLTHTCEAECPYRYYGSLKTQKCQQCVGRCNECITDQQCLTCQIGFLENSTCVDSCQPGYYQNISTLKCQQCSSACLTCAYRVDYCTSCPTGQYRYNNTCLSACPSGYFASPITGACEVCLYPCEKCVGGGNVCASCVDGYLLNSTCYPACPSGYYQDNIGLTCQQCPSQCSKCLSSLTCLQCQPSYKLHQSKCLLSCPSGYYPQALLNTSITICSKCSGLCQTCTNITYCLTCHTNFLASNNSGLCVRSSLCLMSQFANIVTLQCQACSSNCLMCFAEATYCTACPVGSVLVNGTCGAMCPNSYFYNQSVNLTGGLVGAQCTVCEEPCLTCIDQNKCLSCIQGYKYSSLTHICSSTCSIGSFFNKTINDCLPCSTDCLSCDNPLFCYICKANTYLHILSTTENQCLTSCPSNYYADGLTCMKCLFPCALCTSSIDCMTCQNGVLYQKRCLAGCPESTFMNVTANVCENCLGDCMTCKSNATQCLSCKNGLFLMQGLYSCVASCPDGSYGLNITQSCLACPDSCSKCLNNSYCTACVTNKTYLNTATHSCLQFCATGYFGNSLTGSCQACSPKCQTCTTATQCLTCSPGFLLTRLQNVAYDCLTACPAQHYNDSNICYQCTFPCSQCLSASQCLTCASGTFYHSQSHSCLLSCPMGTYYSSIPTPKCNNCVSPCSTCRNQTNCINCVSGYLLYEGTCVVGCPAGYYADGSGICNRCYGVCKTCSGKYKCLTCQTGYAYSGYCYSACPPGTFASESTRKCQPCQSPCLECTNNPTYCKKCQFNMFAYRGSCSSSCPKGTWASGQVCQPCQFPCIKCSNQFTCQECIGGYLLYMRTSCIENQQRCPNDLYKLDSKQCVPSTWCPASYFRDEVIKTCSLSCSREKYVNLGQKACLSGCGSGEYVGKDMTCRNWEIYPPVSLMGMAAIAFIKSSQIHIVVVFNETISWLEKTQLLYQVGNQESGRRLLLTGSLTTINYTLESEQQLVLQISQMPYSVSMNLPAHYLKSSQTSYNLQIPTIEIKLPQFTAYTYEQVYVGSVMRQFSEGITWFIILFSMFFLFMNRLSDAYVLWDTAQLLYLLVFLDIQYPPNLNDFLVGLSNINFLFVPSLFKDAAPAARLSSSSPFYAYAYDNSFLRTAGSPILLIVIVVAIFLILKFIEVLSKHSEKVKEKLDQNPKIKGYIFKGLLRFRWHHTSDVFFLTFDIIALFAVAQIYNIAKNPNNIASNIVCVIILLIYLAFPCFVSYKLYKHFNNIAKGKMVANLQCFYRGIEKTNKFGISLILIRYFRKITYGVIIGVFTSEPMFALPILMFTSVLLGLFMFINKPFKKRLSNIITVATEVSLVLVYILIALIQFGNNTLSIDSKMILGWVCCGILLIVLFTLIFEIFCKTMFYLEPQKEKSAPAEGKLDKQQNELTKKFSQEFIRQKAGEFFDRIFPKLKQNLNLDDSEQSLNEYQEGDSQNSENNNEREKDWGIDSETESKHSDQFRHYGSEESKSEHNKDKNKRAPNYLIRCVKELN